MPAQQSQAQQRDNAVKGGRVNAGAVHVVVRGFCFQMKLPLEQTSNGLGLL